MSDSLSRIEAILASKQPGAAPYTGVPQSRLEEELLETDFSKPTKVVESFSEMTEEGQVYAIRNTEEGEYNSFTEYILVDGSPERIGKQDEIIDAYTRAETDSLLDKKVDKETGKGLSSNDYTTAEKSKLAGIAAGAVETYYDSYTFLASNWDNGTYSLEGSYPSSTYDINGIFTGSQTTDAMKGAWDAASLEGGYKATNVIVATGTVPSIDITMELLISKKGGA